MTFSLRWSARGFVPVPQSSSAPGVYLTAHSPQTSSNWRGK